jgi:hypothetical protein
MGRALSRAFALLVPAFLWFEAVDCHAQRDSAAAVLSVVLSDVESTIRNERDARLAGPMAFDLRTLRAPTAPGPRNWPDSLMLKWVGNVRDSAFTPREARSLLREVNRSRPGAAEWVACGASESVQDCDPQRFALIVAAARPWIRGNVAQVLVSVRYRSVDKLHPSAWYASVLRLECVGERWVIKGWYNQASN